MSEMRIIAFVTEGLPDNLRHLGARKRYAPPMQQGTLGPQ
jgi:hypothetical protein